MHFIFWKFVILFNVYLIIGECSTVFTWLNVYMFTCFTIWHICVCTLVWLMLVLIINIDNNSNAVAFKIEVKLENYLKRLN